MKTTEIPFGRIVHEIDSRAGEKSEDLVLMSVSISRGLIPRSELTDKEPRADDLSIYKRCWQGDVVLNRMSAYQGALGLAHMDGMVSPDYAVLRPNAGLDARFLTYLMKSNWFISEMASRLRGIGSPGATSVRTPRVNIDDLRDISIALPLVEEQRWIADFLDDQVTRIDELITIRAKQVSDVEAGRISKISEMMLTSTNNEMVMRRLLSRRPEYGANEAADHENPDWPRYIRTTDVTPEGSLRPDTFKSLPPEIARPYLLNDGDLLFTRSGATVGKSFIYRDEWGDAAYAGYLIRMTVNRNLAIPEWVKFFSETENYWMQIAENSIQATIPNVSAERYGNLRLPVPSIEKQTLLVAEFEKLTSAARALSHAIKQSIRILKERKSALITAAVTGQLNVAHVHPLGFGRSRDVETRDGHSTELLTITAGETL